MLNMMDASVHHLVHQVVVQQGPARGARGGRIDANNGRACGAERVTTFATTSLLLALPEIVLALSACLILAIDVYVTARRSVALTAMLTMLACSRTCW